MIQPKISKKTKEKEKELRRKELYLGEDMIRMISSYLEWTDISSKELGEVLHNNPELKSLRQNFIKRIR